MTGWQSVSLGISWKSALRLLFPLSIVTVLIYIIVHKVDLGEFYDHLTWRTGIAILTIQIIFALNFFLIGLRFAILTGNINRGSLNACVVACLLCAGLNFAIPARLSEMVKPLYLKQKLDMPFYVSISAVFIERCCDMLALAILVMLALATGVHLSWQLFAIIVAVLFVTLLTLPYFTPAYAACLNRLFPAGSWRTLAVNLLYETSSSIRTRRFWGSLCCSLLIWTISLLSCWLFLYMATPVSLEFIAAVQVFAATTLAHMIPALPGGFGLYEAAGVLVLQQYGFSIEKALGLILSLHIAQIFMSVGGTAVLTMCGNLKLNDLVAGLKHCAKNIAKTTPT